VSTSLDGFEGTPGHFVSSEPDSRMLIGAGYSALTGGFRVQSHLAPSLFGGHRFFLKNRQSEYMYARSTKNSSESTRELMM
jgi:hypothetical protein